jgi:hypothetical protein
MDDFERRAVRAREVLDNELFKGAFENLKEQLRSKRLQADINDEKTHSRLVLAEQIAEGIRRFLEQEIETGQQAALEVDFRRKWYQRGN